MKTSLVFHGREMNVAFKPLWGKKKEKEEEKELVVQKSTFWIWAAICWDMQIG